jgi:nucleoside-diphosphate-sugar epimerase
VGISRRAPAPVAPYERTHWVTADLTSRRAPAELDRAFSGAHAVVHLAWAIQPVRDEAAMWRTNIDGTLEVLAAAGRAGVKHFVLACSLGAYSPRHRPRR